MICSSGLSCDLPLCSSWIRRKKTEHIKTQRRRDAKTQSRNTAGTGVEPGQPWTSSTLGWRKTVSMSKLTSSIFLQPQHAPRASGLSSEVVSSRGNKAIPDPVRRLGAKPTAERKVKGEKSLLFEPGADRTARTRCAGGRPITPSNSPLRLCVSASLRYFLFRGLRGLRVFAVQLPFAVGLVSLAMVIGGSGCASSPKTVPTEPTKPRSEGWTEKGDASWYGKPYHGRRTASGEIYDMHEMTAAHRSLPFGTEVRVQRRDTGAEVEVCITDRGPFIKGRIIDLSYAAAKVIGLDIDGVAPVKIKVLGQSRKPRSNSIVRPSRASDGDQCLWVQVGAFSSSNNAARAVERLKDSGEKALAMEGPDGLERVRVGPFQSGKEAAEALRRLVGEWASARIVECG